MDLELPEAAPAAGSQSRRGEPDIPDVLRRELERLRLLARVTLRLVREHLPLLAVRRAFDLVAVVRVVRFPHHFDAGQFLRLSQIHLPPVPGFCVRRTPARLVLAIDGVLGRMAVLRCGGRRLFPLRQIDRHQFLLGDGERLLVLGRRFVTRPEQGATEKVQVTSVSHRLIVVAERRAKDACLPRPVLVHPRDDEVLDFVANILRPSRNGPRGVEQFEIVVQLLVDRGPVLQRLRKQTSRAAEALHDRMLRGDEGDVDRLLRPVAGGLHAEELEPVVRSRPVAVHRAVEVDCRNTALVGVEDVLNVGQLLHIRRAFVVDDDVVALRPVRVVVDVEPRLGAFVGRVDDRHLDHHAGLDPLFEDLLLLGVIVAAAAENEHCLQRLGPRDGGVLRQKINRSRADGGRHQQQTANQSAHRTSVLGAGLKVATRWRVWIGGGRSSSSEQRWFAADASHHR